MTDERREPTDEEWEAFISSIKRHSMNDIDEITITENEGNRTFKLSIKEIAQ